MFSLWLVALLAITGASANENIASYVIEKSLKQVPDSLLILCHDYEVLPDTLQKLVARRYDRDGQPLPNLILKYNNETVIRTPDLSSRRNNEYSFSWLHRPWATKQWNRAFIVVLFEPQNLELIMKYIAGTVALRTTWDFLLLIPHGEELEESDIESMLFHNQTDLFLFKLIADIRGDDVVLKTACFFCNGGKPRVVNMGKMKWTGENVDEDVEEVLYPNWTEDMGGTHFLGIYVEELDYNYTIKAIENRWPVFPTDSNWVVIGQKLNFTFYAKHLEVDESGLADVQLPNGTWVGHVGHIMHREAVFAPMSPLLYHIMETVDMSRPLLMEPVNFLTRQPRPSYTWTAPVEPYTTGMWGLIFAACVFGAGIFWIILHGTRRLIKINPFHPAPFPRHTFVYSLRYMSFALVEENPSLIPAGLVARVFLIFWWLFAMVITCGYDCKLITFLVSPQLETLPKDMEDLSNMVGKWTWGMNSTHAAFFPMMVAFSDAPYHTVMEEYMQSLPNVDTCLITTIEKNFACLSIQIFLRMQSQLHVYEDGYCPMMLQSDKSILLYLGSLFRKHSVSMPIIDKAVQRNFDAGIFQRFVNDLYSNSLNQGVIIARATNRKRDLSMALKVDQLKGPLVFLVFMLIVSVVVFVVEIIAKCHYQRNGKSQATGRDTEVRPMAHSTKDRSIVKELKD